MRGYVDAWRPSFRATGVRRRRPPKLLLTLKGTAEPRYFGPVEKDPTDGGFFEVPVNGKGTDARARTQKIGNFDTGSSFRKRP